jgi:hypothetical protein
MPRRPDAPDKLDALERDIRRLKLLARGTNRAMAQLEAMRRRDGLYTDRAGG